MLPVCFIVLHVLCLSCSAGCVCWCSLFVKLFMGFHLMALHGSVLFTYVLWLEVGDVLVDFLFLMLLVPVFTTFAFCITVVTVVVVVVFVVVVSLDGVCFDICLATMHVVCQADSGLQCRQIILGCRALHELDSFCVACM